MKIPKLFLNGEKYQIIAIILVMLVLSWIYGCDSKTTSLVDENKRVTRPELQAELDNLLNQVKIRFAQLDKQDEFRRKIAESAISWTTTGTINPLGAITLAAGLFGAGATVDNVRKRKKIRDANKS